MENLKRKMTLNRNKSGLKIIGLYIISLVCIFFYFLMDYHNVIFVLYEKWDMNPDGKFTTLVFTGLLQYGLLIVGICIFSTLSFILIREKIKSE